MERSAVNAYTVVGAFIGVLFGAWASNKLIGTGNPEPFFFLVGLFATPIAAFAYWLISRRYRQAGYRERMFYAVSGWVVLLVSAGIMLAGMAAIFPKPHAATVVEGKPLGGWCQRCLHKETPSN